MFINQKKNEKFMDIRKKAIVVLFVLCFQITLAQTKTVDEIIFGNTLSEKKHAFFEKSSQIIKGGISEPARILLPIEGERVEGGSMTFKMKVDPQSQNYLTVRFWGSDTGNNNILLLFCEGKQIGYRHLGDYDMLDRSNNQAPCPGSFFYVTTPIPISETQRKKTVELSIRSTGRIWGYGNTLDEYQKKMEEPTRGIYKAYTHTNCYFEPSSNEKQGTKHVQKAPIRPIQQDKDVLEKVKDRVNKEIEEKINKEHLNQMDIWFLSDAYYTKWTKGYKNDIIFDKVVSSIDHFYDRYEKDSKAIIEDEWATTGPLSIAIYRFEPRIRGILDQKMNHGRARRENWSTMLQASVNYAKTHRRSYTNQSMIIDWFLYEVNRALMIVDTPRALPGFQTLKYLYESIGLSPWLGSETSNGVEKPLGDNYFQLTTKGLTKELGFVGNYGEIPHWIVRIYEATGQQNISDSRDQLIRDQLLKMLKARSYFRYPSVDNEGNRAMRGEAVIGWRDGGHYPNDIIYGERGVAREATPMMTAATTLDPEAVAFAQQMVNDNQFSPMILEKLKDSNIRSTQMLMRIPDEYELIMKQPKYNVKLPMSEGMPDIVFSDEENGVIAIKNGQEYFYVSLYWRANYAVNFLARIHYITPTMDRVATVFQDVEFTDSGLRYKRPERTNMFFSDARNFYPEVKSAHTGEELPVAKIPEGVKYELGWENVYAGKGEFYTLRYGKYLIGMNCTTNKTFELDIPKANKILNFPTGELIVQTSLSIEPLTTIVLIVE